MEKSEVINPEVMPKEALQIIQSDGLEKSTVEQLRETFNKMFADADKWLAQAKTIKVTDVSQTREMKMAREVRLAIRQIRCDAENTRKRLKADALAKGKAIDGIANILKALVEPVEAYLQDQEDFAKRIEEQKRDELRRARELAIAPFAEFVSISVGFDISAMSQDQFDAMIDGLRIKKHAKEAAEREIEQKRIAEEERLRKEAEEREIQRQKELAEAKAKADAEAKARIEAERKAEEERAKAEQEAAQAKAKAYAERAKMQAKLDAERKERERVQAEIAKKAKAERDEKERREREEAARIESERIAKQKAERAPDYEKLIAFAKFILEINTPALTSERGTIIQQEIDSQLSKFAAWINRKAEELKQ